jgi:hypothetical protein
VNLHTLEKSLEFTDDSQFPEENAPSPSTPFHAKIEFGLFKKKGSLNSAHVDWILLLNIISLIIFLGATLKSQKSISSEFYEYEKR